VSTPYLGEVKLFAFAFPPKGWALCQGQLLPISQNTALFALLGTTYGGNGQTTFALPDFRGRVPISSGQGTGLQNYDLGQTAGVEIVTLAATELPAHTHTVDPSQLTATVRCTNLTGDQRSPLGHAPATEATSVTASYSTSATDASMGPSAIAPAIAAEATGGGQPHNNMQPYTVLNYCIALVGIFPSRA